MAEIRVVDTEIRVEPSYEYGLVSLVIQGYDPLAKLTPWQARKVAMALIAEADAAEEL